MTKQTLAAHENKLNTKQAHRALNVDTPFTVKFGLFLTLLTTFVLPVILFSPLIIAKLLGYPLLEHIGMTLDNFGMFVVFVQTLGLLVSLVVIAKKLKHSGYTWAAVGLKKFKFFQSLRYVTGYYLMLLGLLIGLAIVAVGLGLDAPTPPNDEAGGEAVLKIMGSFWLTFALTVILAPIIEEIVFRGVLFPALKKRYSLPAGTVGSSLIFTLVHVNPIQMLSVFPLGVYLAVMYQRTGSIYPGMILHATWNLLVLMIAQLSVST